MQDLRDLRTLLPDAALAKLRQAYDPAVMSAANVGALATAYPPLGPWAAETAGTFFERPGPLSAKDRERCVIAFLALTGPPMSLGVHVYWGLMEGLGVDEICHVMALAACYGGLPKVAQGLIVVEKLARQLAVIAQTEDCGPRRVLTALVEESRGR